MEMDVSFKENETDLFRGTVSAEGRKYRENEIENTCRFFLKSLSCWTHAINVSIKQNVNQMWWNGSIKKEQGCPFKIIFWQEDVKNHYFLQIAPD